MASVETMMLDGGSRMPALGLGTWQLTGAAARSGVEHALELGYRLIDTSGDYGNQVQIGEALRSSPIGRDEVFLITKVEEDEDPVASARDGLEELGVEQVDLLLLHRPPPDGAGESLWEGLIEARSEGLAREIGVSNYATGQIDRLTESTGETPALNQVEWSPFGHSEELLEHARRNGIVVQAYSPLTRAERLDDERLAAVGERHGKSPAQVLLRWDFQRGAATVPKAADPAHREQNLDVFDFELGEGELAELDDLNEHYSSLAGLPYV